MAAFIKSVDELVERNNEYQQHHSPQPLVSEFASMKLEPSHFVVVGCLDPRANPTDFFGLKLGGCMAIRNAGGRANQGVVNDILVLDSIMGITDVVVTHHTDCGMTHTTDDRIRGMLKKRLPADTHQEIDSLKFGEIKDLEQSIKDDIKYLAESPYLASRDNSVKFHGFLFDIKTGKCQKI